MNCPQCQADNWLMGPEGGGSQNVLCIACGTEYCETPFGLTKMRSTPERIARIYGILLKRVSILDVMLEGIEGEINE